ncbi:MAG: DUF1847 domain-containing protein [Lachnospiraceae bacterium]|jgi:uncharacterized metal-binding protein|nr:DUF1847 domain-containing protein [Lachnospiraceae bacterium]
MYTCASCTVRACRSGDKDSLPKNCPIREEDLVGQVLEEYHQPENLDFYVTSSSIEAIGYGEWVRVRETMEFCRRMGYHKLGLAFCGGLHQEARVLAKILRDNGFEVVSVVCKVGAVDKCQAGMTDEQKVKPGQYEPMCNPIMQAQLLNKEKTQFNIVLGLCVGHDSLFYKYSEAMLTTLVAKDRVLQHNPVGALYGAEKYCAKRLAMNT